MTGIESMMALEEIAGSVFDVISEMENNNNNKLQINKENYK